MKKFDIKRSTASWTKTRDLRHTLIKNPFQQSCFGATEHKKIEKEEEVRRYAAAITLFTNLGLAMSTDPLALIRGVSESVMVINCAAVTFAFPDVPPIVIKNGDLEGRSKGKLVMPKLPIETIKYEQGPSRSAKNKGRDEEKEDRQPEKPME